MELIKKVEGEEEQIDTDESSEMVMLSSKKKVLANVSTVVVKKENLQDQISAYSYLDFVENKRRTISARFNGRIEKLFVDKTGDYIKEGQPLFEIYSPDLVQAQNDFLIALNNSSTNLISASKKKLELFGLTITQIQDLEKNKELNLTVTYHSPFSGTVIEKNVQEGDYVTEGSVIYDVADLSTIWSIAEIYENDLSKIKIGSTVKLTLNTFPGEEFKGNVTFIYPTINSQSRTVKVRSEFASYSGKLKPQMYGETIFSSFGGQGLLVPADAVIFAGKRTVVWVKVDKGKFEPREVKIGSRYKDKYHIISGLSEGTEIAATGGFLIDSESQLKSGAVTGHQHGDNQSTTQQNTNIKSHENHSSPKMEIKSGNEGIIRKGIIDLKSIDKNKDGKVFQDPMDWNVISDKPGKCPLCGMDLEEVTLEVAKKNLIENGFKVK
jgi:multidrug efflux pump subunit AcrA (membrane-fusion protein)